MQFVIAWAIVTFILWKLILVFVDGLCQDDNNDDNNIIN